MKFHPDSVFAEAANNLGIERMRNLITYQEYQVEFETLLAMFGWTREEWLSELDRRIKLRRGQK